MVEMEWRWEKGQADSTYLFKTFPTPNPFKAQGTGEACSSTLPCNRLSTQARIKPMLF